MAYACIGACAHPLPQALCLLRVRAHLPYLQVDCIRAGGVPVLLTLLSHSTILPAPPAAAGDSTGDKGTPTVGSVPAPAVKAELIGSSASDDSADLALACLAHLSSNAAARNSIK